MDIVDIVDIVLGCSFGDEGKGKVVFDLLKNNYDLCVRFNGSGNAGHTIYLDKQKIVVHQLPVGILKPNVYNLISSDCLIHIEKMKKELAEIKACNINFDGRLFISKACHVITNEAIEYDKNNNLIGTTGSGIGYTYAQKMLRTGKRIEDHREEIEQLGIQLVDMREFWSSDFVKSNIRRVLLEGAQGFELDINWTNNYPFCTSSTCSLAGAINTGIPLKKIRNIFGISKIYDTYVGNMIFQPENDEKLNEIGILGHEYGATTGRKRQCNYLNLDNLRDALKINQCNICVINKVDIIEQLKTLKLYHLGQLIEFTNIDEIKQYIISALPFLNEIIFSSNPYTI